MATASNNKKAWWQTIRFWPQSLAGQLIAALLLALLIAQIVTIILFASERKNIARDTMRGQVLERTASVVRVLNQTEESLHQRVIRAAEGPGILYRLRDRTNLSVPPKGSPEATLTRRLERRAGLAEGTVRISNIDSHYFSHLRRIRDERREADARRQNSPNGTTGPGFGPNDNDRRGRWDRNGDGPGPGFRKDGKGPRDKDRKRPTLSALDMTIAVPLENGRWLQVRTGEPTNPAKWGRPFLLSLGITALLILAVVIFTVRRLTAPLRKLEEAAHQLGRGESVEPLEEEGPKEIRNTISAFNAMQERLMRFVQDRTRMLAAISHDLRTPITTMRLRAEFIDDDEMRDKMLATLEEMQAMTEAVLAFAREDASNEETREVDLSALVSAMSDDFVEMGKPVTFTGPDSLIFGCRPMSLKRACRNLIENALRYAGNADVSLRRTNQAIEITVSDNGPGIPEEKIEDAFAPFFRVESSRNLETGGVGLGLSITRTIIRSHGGDITLSNRPEGGLKATITLPA